MTKGLEEQQFEKYREYLQYEATKLTSYILLYRHLNELKTDKLDEMNKAPAFFGITIEVLLTGIILWTQKLFDEKSEQGLVDFLKFINDNIALFDIKEIKKRRKYPDNHWVLRERKKDQITSSKIRADLERVRNLKSYKSIKIKRDKFYAHFDKKYFFDRKKLAEDSPLTWTDLDEIKSLLDDILNTYSTAYDGNMFVFEPMNIYDVDAVLNVLSERRERVKEKHNK